MLFTVSVIISEHIIYVVCLAVSSIKETRTWTADTFEIQDSSIKCQIVGGTNRRKIHHAEHKSTVVYQIQKYY